MASLASLLVDDGGAFAGVAVAAAAHTAYAATERALHVGMDVAATEHVPVERETHERMKHVAVTALEKARHNY